MNSLVKSQHIAPCGMNCRLCLGFMRDKNRCDGCRSQNFKCSRKCIIRYCKKRDPKDKYCYTCDSFPCTRLKNLDKRYRTKYSMSMLNNLSRVKEEGIRQFLKSENANRVCSNCGQIYCIHRPKCLYCGVQTNKLKNF